jgi:hypothetical protein
MTSIAPISSGVLLANTNQTQDLEVAQKTQKASASILENTEKLDKLKEALTLLKRDIKVLKIEDPKIRELLLSVSQMIKTIDSLLKESNEIAPIEQNGAVEGLSTEARLALTGSGSLIAGATASGIAALFQGSTTMPLLMVTSGGLTSPFWGPFAIGVAVSATVGGGLAYLLWPSQPNVNEHPAILALDDILNRLQRLINNFQDIQAGLDRILQNSRDNNEELIAELNQSRQIQAQQQEQINSRELIIQTLGEQCQQFRNIIDNLLAERARLAVRG